MSNQADFIQAIKDGDKQRVVDLLDREPELARLHLSDGPSVLLLAHYYAQPAIVQLLIERGADVDIFASSALGDIQRLEQLLIEDPGGVNDFSGDGYQPLGLAAYFGQATAVRLILAYGAQVHTQARNNMGVTPLHSAAAAQHSEVTQILMDHGADPNAVAAQGFRPLHTAAQNGDVEVARLLLDAGADPNAPAENGLTPIKLAVDEGQAEVADLLRARGAVE